MWLFVLMQNKSKEARAAARLGVPLAPPTRLHCAGSLLTVLDRAGKASAAAARQRLQGEREAAANPGSVAAGDDREHALW